MKNPFFSRPVICKKCKQKVPQENIEPVDTEIGEQITKLDELEVKSNLGKVEGWCEECRDEHCR